MNKFWQVKNEISGGSEILLYGPIASEKSWFGDEATPQQFADDLESLGGRDVTVRINSGGDVFAAHAIHNQLVNYKGKVTVIIDGLAASAATIVAMAGDKIIMPTNAMMMIHNPAMVMNAAYMADELTQIAEVLGTIKSSIISAYQKRCKASVEELTAMMDAETWMGAQECVDKGFADMIQGRVSAALNGNMLVVNSVKCDINTFNNVAGLKKQLKNSKEESNVTKLEQILNKMGLLEDVADGNQPPATQNAAPVDAQQIIAAERQRVAALNALHCDNAAVNAIIDAAVKDGKSVEDVQAYIDAVKTVNPAAAAQNLVADMVQDNQGSGVEGVGATPAGEDAQAAEKAANNAAMDFMAGVINSKTGGKK